MVSRMRRAEEEGREAEKTSGGEEEKKREARSGVFGENAKTEMEGKGKNVGTSSGPLDAGNAGNAMKGEEAGKAGKAPDGTVQNKAGGARMGTFRRLWHF